MKTNSKATPETLKNLFPEDCMEPEVLPAFRSPAEKTCLFSQAPDLRRTVAVNVSLPEEVREGQLHAVHEPQKRSRNGHVPEDQTAFRRGAFGIEEPDPARSRRLEPVEVDLLFFMFNRKEKKK